MKALLTSRSDLRWALALPPALFVGHWLVISLAPVLLHTQFLQSVREVLNLL
jgi:hypothetical protein